MPWADMARKCESFHWKEESDTLPVCVSNLLGD